MEDKSKKPTVPAESKPQPKPSNPLLTVQTAKPETQNRNFELNTTKKSPDKNGN